MGCRGASAPALDARESVLSSAADSAGIDRSRALDRTLARSVVIVGAFGVVTSIARVAQDAAIAWRFGTGPMVDAYYFVASLANWPVAVALSVFTLLVTPLEAGQERVGGDFEVQRFRGQLLGAVLLLALASLPVAWWALSLIAGGSLNGLERSTAALAVAGVPAIVAVVPLGLVGALLAAWLVAAGRHILTLLEALPPLVLIGAVLFVPGPVLFWATAVGVAVQATAMAASLRSARTLPRPSVGFTSDAWHGFAAGALVLLAAQLISTVLPLVDAFFAARLETGTLARLNFANRLVLGVQGLVGLALQRAGLPLISRLVATSPHEAQRAVLRWAGLMAAAGLLIGLGLAVLSDPLVGILYERGRFTAADREQVATLLCWGLLQLVPFLAGVPVVTALASTNARGLLTLAAALGLAVKIGASLLLASRYGAVGLQVATALMYTAAAAAAWIALSHRLRGPASGQHAA
jgi:peptidoglycan biosynthesis protein MviN/MurJ (putative lipid II flippase)